MKNGMIRVPPQVANAANPMCSVCQFGKSRRQPHTTTTGPIDHKHQKPGDGVSADQLEAGCPGIILTSKGSPISIAYHYCNVWVDHYSRLVYVTMHHKKDAKEMLASKDKIESFCKKYGVKVASVRADHGVYTSQLFQASLVILNPSS